MCAKILVCIYIRWLTIILEERNYNINTNKALQTETCLKKVKQFKYPTMQTEKSFACFDNYLFWVTKLLYTSVLVMYPPANSTHSTHRRFSWIVPSIQKSVLWSSNHEIVLFSSLETTRPSEYGRSGNTWRPSCRF